MKELPGDGPSRRVTISEMSQSDLHELLEGIRHRRMQMLDGWKAVQEIKAAGQAVKLQKKLDQQLRMLSNDIARFDKACESAENRLNKVLALGHQVETLKRTIRYEGPGISINAEKEELL